MPDNLLLLANFMMNYQHLFKWVRPQGGCVGFIKYMAEKSVDKFTSRLIEQKRVLLMPAKVYDYLSNHFRIVFGRNNVPQALIKPREFLGL